MSHIPEFWGPEEKSSKHNTCNAKSKNIMRGVIWVSWDCWNKLPQTWWKSESESCLIMSNTLWPHELYRPWNSPGQNAGMGSHSLLREIFPTQGSNPGLHIAGRVFTSWAIGEAPTDLLQFSQFSCSVVSDSSWPHESQHARPPCPSPTPLQQNTILSQFSHSSGGQKPKVKVLTRAHIWKAAGESSSPLPASCGHPRRVAVSLPLHLCFHLAFSSLCVFSPYLSHRDTGSVHRF